MDGPTGTRDVSSSYGASESLKREKAKLKPIDQLEMILYAGLHMRTGKLLWLEKFKVFVQGKLTAVEKDFKNWSAALFQKMSIFHAILMKNPTLMFDGNTKNINTDGSNEEKAVIYLLKEFEFQVFVEVGVSGS